MRTTQLTNYLDFLSQGFAWLTVLILFLMIAWIISQNSKGKLILAIVYTIAIAMTSYAVAEMATLTSCEGLPIHANPVRCFLILLTPWLIVCLVHVRIGGRTKSASHNAIT
jgi:hypothetical protein